MSKRDFPSLVIPTIAIIELAIGAITILGLTLQPFFYITQKPFNVTMFVVISAATSAVIGCGILKRRGWARYLLVFFSGYVVLTKLLIFAGLLELKGAIITVVPSWSKDLLSLAYHAVLIILLENAPFKQEFDKTSEKRP